MCRFIAVFNGGDAVSLGGSCMFVVGDAILPPCVHVNVTGKCKGRQLCKDFVYVGSVEV